MTPTPQRSASIRSGRHAAARARRRGSTLVLVVSAIALLSVLVAAYLAISRADVVRSRTTLAAEATTSRADDVASYIARILADDVLAVHVEGQTYDYSPSTLSLVRREATDYPFTDWQRRSEPTAAPGTPAYDRQRFSPVGTLSPDWVRGTDIEPFGPSDPFLASTLPTWLNPTPGAPADDWLRNSRDWAHISNIAPDGRFVNLHNLRNNFAAPPGRNGMSRNLSLFDSAGTPQLNPQLDIGITADPDVPAHWDSRQREMFRPAVGIIKPTLAFDDPLYLPYQYADTDGDGFFDARWQELADTTDPLNIRWALPTDRRHRWFVAARIVDLASLVNVNTATDLRRPPAADAPLGITPADVDLRRLLTLADAAEVYQGLSVDGYNQIRNPPGTPAEQDYSGYTGTTTGPAFQVADAAFNALTEGIFRSQLLDPNAPPLPYQARQAHERLAYYLKTGSLMPGRSYHEGATWQTAALFGLDDLLELLTYRGINDSGTLSRLEQTVAGRTTAWPAYSPLRSNRWTRLERDHLYTSTGRATDPAPGNGSPLFWSALDVRQLLTTVSWARPLISAPLVVDLSSPGAAADTLAEAARNLEYAPPSVPQEVADLARETPLDVVETLDRIVNTKASAEYQKIFRAYAHALLPLAHDPTIWTVPAKRSVSYGNNPEFALKVAAALTVNLIDLYDPEPAGDVAHEPTSRTVLFRRDKRAEVDADPIAFPWWDEAPLDLGDAFLPTQGTNIRALNVHGFEAQPFLTEAAVYNIYTDTPNSRGGDKDWELIPDPIDPTATVPDPSKQITIDGDISATNPDFIGQVAAFQVSNPFDYAITLSRSDPTVGDTQFPYYIEFGGNQFPLAAYDETAGAFTAVTIQPGETIVFYALSMPKGDGTSVGMSTMNGRLKNADADNVLGFQDVIGTWLDQQIPTPPGSGVRKVRTHAIDAGAPKTGLVKLLDGVGGGGIGIGGAGDANREVRLWRMIIQTATGETAASNRQSNDILLDRMRDPAPATGRPTLDQRIPEADEPGLPAGFKGRSISGTQAGEEGSLDPARRLDNTGYTITTWGAIRRPTEGLGNATPRGALPAWCIERKFGPSLNGSDDDPANPQSLVKCDFASAGFCPVLTSPKVGGTTLDEWRDRQAPSPPASAPALLDTISKAPDDKDVPPLPVSAQADFFSFSQIYAEAHLRNDRFRENDPTGAQRVVMRPADVLLPLAVCATHDPDADNPATLGTDERWTTFGESLAQALGYDAPPPGPVIGGGTPPPSVYDALDRGHLELHGYFDRARNEYRPALPFVDADADLHLDPNNPNERRLGLGIPFAQAVVDRFWTFSPKTGSFKEQYGSIGAPTVGVINVNTAPLPVLRLIPGLSPSTIPGEWWWNPGTGDAHTPDSDVAATLYAYRERTSILPRRSAIGVSFVGESGVPGNPFDALTRFDPARKNYALFGLPTGVAGIRPDPGLASRAELLAANHYVEDLAQAPVLKHNIDHLGDPDDNSTSIGNSTEGIDPVRYGSGLDDGIPNDYDEQLLLADAALHSVSVRSDTFACWFIIHGYTEADTTGLDPTEPLVPSVARRFLMIIDRSNVTRLGDRPRILLMRELPMP